MSNHLPKEVLFSRYSDDPAVPEVNGIKASDLFPRYNLLEHATLAKVKHATRLVGAEAEVDFGGVEKISHRISVSSIYNLLHNFVDW